MDTLLYITWDAAKDKPLGNIIMDEEPIFDLAIFDYSGTIKGKYTHFRLNGISGIITCAVHSEVSEGKGDIIRYISNIDRLQEPEYIGIIDDDILIRVSDINRAVRIAERENFTSFQPSLARCSYYSHGFTLNHPNSSFRKVDWVEIMMPVLKSKLMRAVKPFLEYSISSWGLDCYAFPMLAFIEGIGNNHAVIDASIAAHIRRIRSGHTVYRNGLTASQEKDNVKEACKRYLASIGYN